LLQETVSYRGIDPDKILIKHFVDGFMCNCMRMRGCDMFLVQPTRSPVNENPMDLFIMIDACRRASAWSIIVVIPYFWYARADSKVRPDYQAPYFF
jgi:ribose-phosphate pyrophosphokinase